MYRLTIIAGPSAGHSFRLQEGDNAIGRQEGNVVVLPSSRVSKRHCVLVVNNDAVTLMDQGSSNGTFVNGVLAKSLPVRAGDRISVGEYILELVRKEASSRQGDPHGAVQLDQMQRPDNVLPFPLAHPSNVASNSAGFPANGPGGISSTVGLGLPQPGSSEPVGSAPAPAQNDIWGKFMWNLERHVMPNIYGALFKYEWKWIGLSMFGLLVVCILFIAIQPLLDQGRKMVMKESVRRARHMARVIVERNAPAIAAGTETKTEIGSADREEGVRLAILMDIDNRILAPATRMNQALTNGPEALFAIKALKQYQNGAETGMAKIDGDIVIVAEPLKVVNPRKGSNEVKGMALVSIDTSISTPNLGEVGMVYSETFLITALLSALFGLIFYRLTLKPFEVLNEDVDKALKGELSQVTREFKIKELNPLFDVINSAIQRLPKDSVGGGDAESVPSVTLDDFLPVLSAIGDLGSFGVAICDEYRKICYLNPYFEDVTGIRSDSARGEELASVARDQAFSQLITDMLDQSQPGSVGMPQDYEFGGTAYRLTAAALGSATLSPKGYLITVVRSEGGG